jgi:uncharacterized membrane protein
MEEKKVRTVVWIAIGLVGVLDLILAATHQYHSHLAMENLPFFGVVVGFLAAMAIALVAKFLGHALLTKDEDYYD